MKAARVGASLACYLGLLAERHEAELQRQILLVHVDAAGIQSRQNRPSARADLRGRGQSVHVSLGW